MKEWVTVKTYKGYNIKVLDGAELGDEFGYKVDCMVLWNETFQTVEEAEKAIDEIVAD